MEFPALTLSLLTEHLAICRLAPQRSIPAWATSGSFFSITRTDDELSIICRQESVPAGVTQEPNWRALKLEGPFDFNQIGILVAVARPLAEAEISILAVATYDTDYVLIQQSQLERALGVLAQQGHRIQE